jgi:hypothetical protein
MGSPGRGIDSVASELDRERIRRRINADPPFRLDLGGELVMYANQSENVGRKRRRGEPDLALGLLRDDVGLAAAALWGVAEIVRAWTFGHVRVEIVDNLVRPVGTDPIGDALLRSAAELTQGIPGRRVRRCVRCGKEITHLRSTRLCCGNACKQAVVRARKRTREEEAQ